MLSKGEKQ